MEYSIFGDGRYPIFNKTTARNALLLRGRGNLSKKKRLYLIEVASKYVPQEACKALISDIKKKKV
jgi:hypothetical protein